MELHKIGIFFQLHKDGASQNDKIYRVCFKMVNPCSEDSTSIISILKKSRIACNMKKIVLSCNVWDPSMFY